MKGFLNLLPVHYRFGRTPLSFLMLQTAKWQVAAKECVENSEDEVKHEAKREVKLRSEPYIL